MLAGQAIPAHQAGDHEIGNGSATPSSTPPRSTGPDTAATPAQHPRPDPAAGKGIWYESRHLALNEFVAMVVDSMNSPEA
jgi:hypothetical protein